MVSQETFERVQARQIARQIAREQREERRNRIAAEIMMWLFCIVGGFIFAWCAIG